MDDSRRQSNNINNDKNQESDFMSAWKSFTLSSLVEGMIHEMQLLARKHEQWAKRALKVFKDDLASELPDHHFSPNKVHK